MTTSLLQTKLYIPPYRPSELVLRQRLLTQLDQLRTRRVIVVAHWVQQTGQPTAWLAVSLRCYSKLPQVAQIKID